MASRGHIKYTFIENLLYCYAISIKKIFNGWNHSHFELIDKYNTKAVKNYIKQDISITCKSFNKNYSEVIFQATPNSLLKINKELFKIFKEKSKIIEDLFMESFKDFMKLSNNNWIQKISGKVNFTKITKIFMPIDIVNDTITFYFEPQPVFDILTFWKPLQLCKYYKSLYIYKYNSEEKFKIEQDIAKKKLIHLIENRCLYINYPKNLFEELHKISYQTFDQYYEEKINSFTNYTNNDPIIINKLREKGNIVKFSLDDFISLCGKKRKRED